MFRFCSSYDGNIEIWRLRYVKDIERLKIHGIEIVRGPVTEPWGKVVVLRDLYGNLWDLVEPVAEK